MSKELGPPMAHAAVCQDPWAARLAGRATQQWWEPLWWSGCCLPWHVAFDYGVLLVRPEAWLSPGGPVSAEYVDLLRQLVADERFRRCSDLVASAERSRQDETLLTAIRSMTRPAQGLVTDREPPAAALRRQIDQALAAGFRMRDQGGWLTAVDEIEIRAASWIEGGPRLLDYPLLDECLRDAAPVPRHALRTQRSPTRQIGIKEVSRRQGDIIGYTGVRPRLPTDDLTEILPSEWALVRRKEGLGLDKILNRTTLVHSKESPHDLVPRLHVLLAFIIDVDPSLYVADKAPMPEDLPLRERKARLRTAIKSVVYRMVRDAAEQVPFRRMAVHAAVYEVCFGSAFAARASCFDLREVSPEAQSADRLVRYDTLVPCYFYGSYLKSARGMARTGPWPELADNPYVFLMSASAAVRTYTSVLAVILSHPDRWPVVFPSGHIPLRPVEPGRPTALLVQPHAADALNTYGWCSFCNLRDAAIGHVSQFRNGTDVDVRNALLDMLLGPVRVDVAASTAGRIEVD